MAIFCVKITPTLCMCCIIHTYLAVIENRATMFTYFESHNNCRIINHLFSLHQYNSLQWKPRPVHLFDHTHSLLLQFIMMGMTMYKEVLSDMIGYLVERIQTNYALQLIPNSFLANSGTSSTFASILLTFLLKVS